MWLCRNIVLVAADAESHCSESFADPQRDCKTLLEEVFRDYGAINSEQVFSWQSGNLRREFELGITDLLDHDRDFRDSHATEGEHAMKAVIQDYSVATDEHVDRRSAVTHKGDHGC